MKKHVVVIGGGVIGLASAYYLARADVDVTVLERSTVGSGASWGNAGWIMPTLSAPLPAPGMAAMALRALARSNGSFYISLRHLPQLTPWLWRFWRSSSAARHRAGLLATAMLALPTHELYDELAVDGVTFEMIRTGLVYAFVNGEKAEITRQHLLPLIPLGYTEPGVVLDGRDLQEIEPALGDAVEAGFVVTQERTVHPGSLLAGLKARLVEMGVETREHHPVSGFFTHGDRITAVRGDEETIESDDVVLAAGVWTRQLAASLDVSIPLQAGKGYSFMVTASTMPSHSLYLYEAKVGATPFADGMRVAGTMELSGVNGHLNRRRIAAVARAARPYLAGWEPESLRDEWVGMRPMTPDGLPVIGRAAAWRNLYLATGHAMLGMTLAPATGHLLAQLIVDDVDPDVLRPFSPDRFTASRPRTLVAASSRR